MGCGWKAACRQPNQSIAGARLCWYVYKGKIKYDSTSVCQHSDMSSFSLSLFFLPAALWWSCADTAALWTADRAQVRRPPRAQMTGRWTFLCGSYCCWAGSPTAPGTADRMPRKDVTSGLREARERLSGWNKSCKHNRIFIDPSEVWTDHPPEF